MDVKLIREIREDFPILKRQINGSPMVYLASAATTQKPTQVLDVLIDYYKHHNAKASSVNKLSNESKKIYEKAKERVAEFINASPNEIIFTKNTTEAINLVSYSYGLGMKKKSEIITTEMEHHSNIIPWQFLEQKNKIKMRFLGMRENSLNLDEFENMMGKKTRLVAACHISNVTGRKNPVKEMAKIAHEHDAYMLVDGAQSVPRIPIDVKKLDCDFLAFSGHKMLGPLGTGCLYVKREIMKQMRPFICGGEVKKVTKKTCEFTDEPERFEGGTQNVAGIIGLAAAIDYLEKTGMKNIEKYNEVLSDYAVQKMKEVGGVNIYSYGNGIVSFNVKQLQPHDVANLMSDKAIMITAGNHNCMPLMDYLGIQGLARLSTYIYNTKNEINRFAERLQRISSLGTKRLIVKE